MDCGGERGKRGNRSPPAGMPALPGSLAAAVHTLRARQFESYPITGARLAMENRSGTVLLRMKILSLVLFACLAVPHAARAGSFADAYAGQGELLVVHLTSAPFPHPARAEGHKYRDQFFSASEHYSDDTVGIFIPKGFREDGPVDFVVHFHGWQNNVTNALARYQFVEQFVASKRNAILVVPQGPRDASDSFGGKLEDANGFARFMEEVSEAVAQKSSLKSKTIKIGSIVLSGHSGGYQVISSILDQGGLTGHVKEVWLFDALYARTEKFLAWWDGSSQGRLIDIYTEHGGTKKETEQLMATLKNRGTQFFAAKESATHDRELKDNRLVFIYTPMAHDEVMHGTFRQFLSTSCLASLKD
jgi:hypothetical protein